MTSGQDEIPVPRLCEGWDAAPRPSEQLGPPPPRAGRYEKERRDLTKALLIFLVAALVLLLLGYRSLAVPAFGVTVGWAIRLFLVQRKIDRLRSLN